MKREQHFSAQDFADFISSRDLWEERSDGKGNLVCQWSQWMGLKHQSQRLQTDPWTKSDKRIGSVTCLHVSNWPGKTKAVSLLFNYILSTVWAVSSHNKYSVNIYWIDGWMDTGVGWFSINIQISSSFWKIRKIRKIVSWGWVAAVPCRQKLFPPFYHSPHPSLLSHITPTSFLHNSASM